MAKDKIQQKPQVIINNGNLVVEWCDKILFYLLVITIFTIPIYFNIVSYDQFEMPKLTLLRILTSVMLGIWLIKTLELGKFSFTPTPLDLPMFLWVILNIITTFHSVSPSISFRGEYENFAGSLSNINYVAIYYIATQNLKGKKQFFVLNWAFLFSGLIITVYAIAQYFGYDIIKWNDTSVIKGRFFATMGNPNFLGALIIMVIPVTISFFLILLKNQKKNFAMLLVVLFVLLYMALIGTQSRGPFLGFVFAFLSFISYGLYVGYKDIVKTSEETHISVFLVLRTLVKKFQVWIVGLLVVIILSVALSLTIGKDASFRLLNSIVHVKNSLQISRLHIWIPAFKVIKAHPFLGTGVDTFKTVFPAYEGTNFAQIDGANVSSRTAHNELLNIPSTMGLSSLGIYLLLIVAYIKLWADGFRRIKEYDLKILSFGMFAAFIAYFIQNIFSFGVAAINTAFYLFMGIHAVIYNDLYGTKKKDFVFYRSSEANIIFRWILQFGAVFLAFFLSFRAYSIFDADVHYNRGKILGDVYNRWDLSVKEHEISVREEPDEVKYHVYLGLAYEQLALQMYTALTSTTKPPTIDEKQQLIQSVANYIEIAIKEYKKGTDLNPGNSYYWGNIARIYSLLGRMQNPDFASGKFVNMDSFNSSIYYYAEAIKRAPVTGLFYFNLIDLYFLLYQLDKIPPILDSLMQCDKQLASTAAFKLANIYFTSKKFNDAEKYYLKVVELTPDFAQAYYNLGVLYAATGKRDQANPYLSKAFQLNPDLQKEIAKQQEGKPQQ